MAALPKVRAEAYRAVLQTEQGREVLDDLVKFAQAQDVTEARLLGRADVVLRFENQKRRAGEKEQESEE